MSTVQMINFYYRTRTSSVLCLVTSIQLMRASSFFKFCLLALLFFSCVEAFWNTKNVKSKTEASDMRLNKAPKRTLHSTKKAKAPKVYGKMSKGRQKEKTRKGPKTYLVTTMEDNGHKNKKGVVAIPGHDRYIQTK